MKLRWYQWLPWWRWRILGTVDAADEVPDRLPAKGMVMVGTWDMPKWIVFDCPCGAGHRMMLSASKSRKPRWTIDGPKRTTLLPSVDAWHAPGVRCHYFIRRGKVEWVRHH